MLEYARIVHAAGSRFYWPGAEREDVEQEAWLALAETRPSSRGLAKVIVRRHLADKLKASRREKRAQLVVLDFDPLGPTLDDQLADRECVWLLRSVALTDSERDALGRLWLDEPVLSRSENNARQRVRSKFRAATMTKARTHQLSVLP